ncbi:MAG: hypothetical protein ACR2PS_05565 [Pseudomonadales bacterium]
MNKVKLRETTDASVWAKEFMRITNGTVDEGTMIAWFSNMWAATYDPLATKIEQLSTEYRDLKTLAGSLVDKLDECQPHIDNAFVQAFMIRGHDYTGPNYEKELQRVKDTLQVEQKP